MVTWPIAVGYRQSQGSNVIREFKWLVTDNEV